jgi:hypothetical protein
MKKKIESPDFVQKIKQTLANRAGQTCSNPNCRKPTSGPHTEEDRAINLGEAAHIKAAHKGPRYDLKMTNKQRRHISNGIWLCIECARRIDIDEAKYTVDLLVNWKKIHEKWIAEGKPTIKTPKPPVDLCENLTYMHRRLIEIQKEKALKTNIKYNQWEKSMPTLAIKLGIEKYNNLSQLKKMIKERIVKGIPRPRYNGRFSFKKWAEYRARVADYREKIENRGLSVASEIKNEIFKSKKWTLEDGNTMSQWLDGYQWGVKDIRDNDQHWRTSYESISDYFSDEILSSLIQQHKDISYMYNNVSLILYYSSKFPKTSFASNLHEVLVGSSISPIDSELALAEILVKIKKRLSEISRLPTNAS